MTSAADQTYRWSPNGFLRAYEAGAFDARVELIDGEVVPVVIGEWHGETAFRIGGILRDVAGGIVTGSTLSAGDSLPDPDCWVRRAGAEPAGQLSDRLSVWKPADVLLVVEVSDESVMRDLTVKPAIYGSAGYPTYWVITRDAIYEHTDPTAAGYRTRTEYRRGERIGLRYAGTELSVGELLGPVD
ncbi:Uma2 family endonuclease [Microlunatus elymi]|uniref:Uma2 family endonuclease n=1 Tax=Microlunatus elymi TaxID=2596828 RepID=UPI00143CF600|nr:Uma2 family endonuclease [Microlunatus elymi]